jgi:hypothetical protein
MKNKIFIIVFCLLVIGCVKTVAQSSSTEEDPKWYYIQVKGGGLTANRVLTEVDGQVLGQALKTESLDALSKQLWRFEIPSGASGYRIINKYSKKQLTVVYDATGNARRPAVTENSSTIWSFTTSPTPGYKYVKILNEPEEGVAGSIYLSQTAYNNNAYKLVTESSRTTDNELFRCVLNEVPVVSDDNVSIWMNIRNPQTNKYLTDAVSSAPGINFMLDAKDNSQSQQWKIIAGEEGTVQFVNRATGNTIPAATNLNKYYYIQYPASSSNSTGWQCASISSTANQYEVFSVSGGVTSYWNATTDGQKPLIYSAGNTANSTYAWVFTWVDEIYTGFTAPAPVDNVRVYSRDKRIYVEGCDEYLITALTGTAVRKNTELPSGIYLVTVKGKTTKILVK